MPFLKHSRHGVSIGADERYDHIAACLGYGEQQQRLLVSGGAGDGVSFDVMWLLDPLSGRIEQVRITL